MTEKKISEVKKCYRIIGQARTKFCEISELKFVKILTDCAGAGAERCGQKLTLGTPSASSTDYWQGGFEQ